MIGALSRPIEMSTNEALGDPYRTQLLIENFDIVAAAAGGVQRLKKRIVSLALQGGISRSVKTDQSVVSALKRVTEDRSWRVEERSSNSQKLDLKIEALAGVTRLPPGWEECRLNDVAQLVNGRAYAQPELLPSGTPVIRIQNLNGGKDWYYSDLALPDRQYCDKGDLLFAWSASFGPYIWDGSRAIYHYHIWKIVLSSAVDIRFLYFSLLHITDLVREQSHGLAMLHMTKGQMERWPIILPPIEEQKRIVAKVDQLMALCDQLEAKQAKQRKAGDRLTKVVLGALAAAETPEEFKSAWVRLSANFAKLITTPDDVVALRDLVLDLGVRGLLSRAERGDESADALCRELDSFPEQRRRRSSSSSDDPQLPLFHAPARWGWRPLDLIADIVGGVTKGRDLRGRRVGSFPYLRVANVQRGSLDLEVMKEIEIPVEELEKYQLKPGDILFTEGGDWDKVGRSAVWSGQISPCLHQNHVFRARVLLTGLESRWFSMVGNSPTGRRYFERAAKQTTNLASINMTQLRAFPMPLPPREEQRRILARVEALMKVCDELEARLQQRDDQAQQLADALVASAVLSAV